MGISTQIVWHDTENLPEAELVVLPGGSSFCDYLRPGALAKTSPISASLRRFGRSGKILGIGNGFQILCELGILPGTLLPNLEGEFVNKEVFISQKESVLKGKPVSTDGLLGKKYVLACECGSYYLEPRRLGEAEDAKQIVFCYADKEGEVLKEPPTGSKASIAGITNASGNVLGVMFHPERSVEADYGGEHGREILKALLVD
jgi:phosphoribosylformylglycinamidine synthase